MKAGVLYGKKDIRYTDYEEPNLKNDDEVKINVEYCGICGSDIPRVNKGTAHFFPIVLGHEFSGTVTEVGKNVKNVKVGDAVSVAPLIPCNECVDCKNGNYSLCKNYTFIGSRIQGGFAEYITVPSQNVVAFDKSLDFKKGAMFEPSTVALHGLKCADYKDGKNVLVIGCGTIGAFTIQWLKILGVKNLTVLLRNSNYELAKRLGADHIILSKDDIEKESAEITNSLGYDYVFDAVGSAETIQNAFKLVANKGKVMLIGTPTEEINFTTKMWEYINRKEFNLSGSWMSYSSPFPGEEWTLTKEAFESGKLQLDDEMINKIYNLEHIDQAFEDIDTHKGAGRVLVKIKK